MVPDQSNRDSASAAGDNQLSGVHEGTDCADFNDFGGLRRSNDTAVAAACVFLHDISVFFFRNLSLFFCHKMADWLGRGVKCRILRIDADLCDHGRNRNIRDVSV